MHFVIRYRDNPGAEDLRRQHHPAHIQFRKGLGADVLISGPLLAPDSDRAVGSLIILAAPDLATARATAAMDPLAVNGVFEIESITPFRLMAINPPPAKG